MLRYANPAHDWGSALPLGNGRLGAMLYGDVHTEVLRLNEESVWYGGPMYRTPTGAKDHLQQLRKLVRAGKHRDAESLVTKRFLATPRSARHYEPLGTCKIDFSYSRDGPGHTDVRDTVERYERTLDLGRAEAVVQYTVNGATIRRETIATHADNVLVMRISAESQISCTISLTRMSDVDWEVNEFLDSISTADGRIVLHATPGGKGSNPLCFAVGARVEGRHGCVKVVGQELEITGTEALIVIAAQTQYRYADIEKAALADIDAAFKFTAAQIWKRHIDDWTHHYNRMSIQLFPDASSILTNDRLDNAQDPGLVSLYHSYGRYLLLSCSRWYPKALPATLQGIWNPHFHPPWGSKYTININLQMNYWLAHTSNLSECEYPVFDLLERMATNGRQTASEVWGCRGWCAHHSTDIFGDTETQDRWMPSTLWPLGGAWMCTHIWEHYVFTESVELLSRMLPTLEGCVQFLLDFLIEDSSGTYLVTNPSLSPENTFFHAQSGEKGVFCEGSTMDTEIVRTVFTQYLLTISTLQSCDYSSALCVEVKAALCRLQPITVSPKTGTIQEWGLHDYEETELGHRHVSHLYALHPGNIITPSSSPLLAEAAIRTLSRRLEHGGGHTGWSRAWLINLWARLRQPEQCARNIEALLRDSTLVNMLDTHPPFQIDGNFGGAAGVIECLVQSHEQEITEGKQVPIRVIRLLPSCPAEWKKGSVKGVKCRGGFELDFSWEGGRIIEPVTVSSNFGNDAVLVGHSAGADVKDASVRIPILPRKGVQIVHIEGLDLPRTG